MLFLSVFDNIVPSPITDSLQGFSNYFEAIGLYIGRLAEELTNAIITVEYYIEVANDYVSMVVPPQFAVTFGLFLGTAIVFRLLGWG